MTRINCVPVDTLTRQHLVAEYRELPRIFGLVLKAHQSGRNWRKSQPKEYCLGTGHVLFFYDKLLWLAGRHRELVNEMEDRGYTPQFTTCLYEQWGASIPLEYWKGWNPTPEAITINQARIDERNKGK